MPSRTGEKLYRAAREHFVERNFGHLGDMMRLSQLPQFVSLRVHERMHRLVGRHFRDPRLRQLFTFDAMYIGMNPCTAPAIYALLPYNDTVEGVYVTRGGMYALVEGLERLCVDLGVRGELDGLRAHNVVFGPDYEGHFTDVFAGRVHEGPAYYVHVPSMADPSLAPEGHHVVYVLVPHANSDADIDREHERDRVRRYVLDDPADKGWDIRDRIVCEEHLGA